MWAVLRSFTDVPKWTHLLNLLVSGLMNLRLAGSTMTCSLVWVVCM